MIELNTTIQMMEMGPDSYLSISGHTLARESGKTTNGNDFRNMWVLRAPGGSYMDHDQYSNDLAERHNLRLRDL